jgi:hypothetical protein
MSSSKDVATRDDDKGGYVVLSMDQRELQQTIQDNLGGDALSAFDLDRVKVPTGGGTSWSVPGAFGDESLTELRGVIIHWQNRRAYWPEAFSGNTPPDCSSPDGELGYGNPGDALRAEGKGCADCPHSARGSADDGVGQGCKAMRQLFLLRPSALLPVVVTAPPASLAPVRKYFVRLVNAGVHFTAVETVLKLEKAQSKAGNITYAKIAPEAGQQLPPEEAQRIRAYAEQLKPAFARAAVQREDVEG